VVVTSTSTSVSTITSVVTSGLSTRISTSSSTVVTVSTSTVMGISTRTMASVCDDVDIIPVTPSFASVDVVVLVIEVVFDTVLEATVEV